MDKSLLDITYEKTKNLERDKSLKEEGKFAKKSIKFCCKDTTQNLSKGISFEGLESLAMFIINVNVSSSTTLEVALNGVKIIKESISGRQNFVMSEYVNANNLLNISLISNVSQNLKIEVEIIGNIKNAEKNYIKLDFKPNEILIQNKDFVSKTNNILTINNIINKENANTYDKIYNISYKIENSQNFKNSTVVIYKENNKNYFANLDTSQVKELSDFSDACILPCYHQDYAYIFATLYMGVITIHCLDSTLTEIKSFGIYPTQSVVAIDSIVSSVSDEPIFVAKTSDSIYHLIGINFSNSTANFYNMFCGASWAKFYWDGGELIVVHSENNGVTFEKFSTYQNSRIRLGSSTYLNADDGFFYNGKKYLITGDILQELND